MIDLTHDPASKAFVGNVAIYLAPQGVILKNRVCFEF